MNWFTLRRRIDADTAYYIDGGYLQAKLSGDITE